MTKKLLGANGLPYTKPGIIGAEPKTLSPQQEVSRMIRRIETAMNREDEEFLMATILMYAEEGWKVVSQQEIGPRKAEVTIVSHLRRSAGGDMEVAYERILRLGTDYIPALQKLQSMVQAQRDMIQKHIEEQQKERAVEQDDAPETATPIA